MRQRCVKNRDQIVESCASWQLPSMEDLRTPFSQVFGNDRPVFIEIGSGKGRFITQMAALHPENNYIACEGGKDISVRILQKAAENDMSNLRVLTEYITWKAEASDCDGERGGMDPSLLKDRFAGIYINFCDPWPKDRHAKRRLTYRKNLEAYKVIAAPGAHLYFKTDNEALFDFSLEETEAAGLKILRSSRDLHKESWAADNIMTEYEEKFSSSGKNIFYMESILKME